MAHESNHHQEKRGSLISPGYNGYPDYSTNNSLMQSYDPNPAELFNLQTGMELLGMPSKNNSNSLQLRDPRAWRGFLEKPGNIQVSSSSKALATADPSSDLYHPPGFTKPEFSSGDFSETSTENLMGAPETTPWQANRLVVDDSSLRCLFPGVGNDQANQGLSLSLFNPQHSDVGLEQPEQNQHQTFEIRGSSHQQDIGHLSANLRDGLLGKVANLHPQQQQSLLHDPRVFSSPSPSLFQQPPQLRCSKYLVPTQELLIEFCSLGPAGGNSDRGWKNKSQKSNQWQEGGSSSSSTTQNQSLQTLDLMDLQNRKAKLLSMLEEVDRRYRKYCEQMRVVVSCFESVAGAGSARVYSTLASKAMSRHFRCLRDGIVAQIRATKKTIGEKDPAAPGATRGETPRLRLLDQCLRQQKAFQQGGIMESHPWRPQRGLPERSVSILRAWLFEHFLHPYPSDVDKHILARQTGLSRSQVSNWFINARVRLWKPMVEEMYTEETKELENQSSFGVSSHEDGSSRLGSTQNPNPNNNPSLRLEDQKPLTGHLGNESDSLSSIINSSHNSEGRDPMGSRTLNQPPRHQQQQQQFSRQDNFGMVDIDFSSYNDCGQPSFGNGVSLTLGLQQHDGGGMSLSFSSAPQNSLFFSREPMETGQPVQFSILDGDGQNLPYRNLMGTQMLHDLAG